VPIERVINAGGIPQNNAVLNQVYANVFNKPVLVPSAPPTSIGSGIFAQLAAGIFPNIESAQQKMCPEHNVFLPEPKAAAVYEKLYPLYRRVYFAFGDEGVSAALGDVLRSLREIAAEVRAQA
jgi:L-ribulokinase